MMKFKRIFLVLTIGVSFAPPVFASVDLSSYRPQVARTGELEEPNALASQCEYSQVNKGAQDSSSGSGSSGLSGTAL